MTEDADLGLRLHRLGFRTRVITRPTFEDAPTNPAIWMPQRVRWFKGWLQTWLVMIRAPRRWWREMGARAFLASQLMIGGLLFSALVHPLMLAFAVLVLVRYGLDPAYLGTPMSACWPSSISSTWRGAMPPCSPLASARWDRPSGERSARLAPASRLLADDFALCLAGGRGTVSASVRLEQDTASAERDPVQAAAGE